jgi:peptidoglycan/LPS O-acetylase OafA/YrhL
MTEYLKQIDALRCYAVFSVMVSHLYPAGFPVVPFLKEFYGFLPGVPLFFCISGFLISGILVSHVNQPRKSLLKNFYVRRFLRIFPIYYLTIFLLFVINVGDYRSWFIYDVFYVSNIVQGINGTFEGSVAPHFWSLAVEEQFYILWPLLLILSRNSYYHLFLCLVVFISGSLLMIFSPDKFFMARTFGCLAYLGSGALLAMLWHYYKERLLRYITALNICLLILLLLPLLQSLELIQVTGIQRIAIAIFFIPLVTLKFAFGFKAKAAKLVVENPVILYLGKISYGIYIFHLLALFPAVAIKKYLHVEVLENLWVMFFFKIALTILISALSWEFFEKKINNLKKKFRYI